MNCLYYLFLLERVAGFQPGAATDFLRTASAMWLFSFWTIDSHVLASAIWIPRAMASRSGRCATSRHNLINSSCEFAIFTTDPKFRTTSGTAVLTMFRPVAMYSRALVGLIYSVASFNANGMMQTSNALQQAGRSAYSRPPSQCRLDLRGMAASSTLIVGPMMTTDQFGSA